MATVASTSARSQPSTSTLPCTFTTETWPPGGRSKRLSQTRSAPNAGRSPPTRDKASVRSKVSFNEKGEIRKSKFETREMHVEFRVSSFEFRFSSSGCSWLLVMVVVVLFLLTLLPVLPVLFPRLVTAILFRALLLPGLPIAFLALLQLL